MLYLVTDKTRNEKYCCIFTGFGLPGFTTRVLFFDLIISLLQQFRELVAGEHDSAERRPYLTHNIENFKPNMSIKQFQQAADWIKGHEYKQLWTWDRITESVEVIYSKGPVWDYRLIMKNTRGDENDLLGQNDGKELWTFTFDE